MRVELCLALVLTGSTAMLVSAHEASPSRYDFKNDIRPIFLKHCGGCHRVGGVAPMSLLEYSEAVPWANAV